MTAANLCRVAVHSKQSKIRFLCPKCAELRREAVNKNKTPPPKSIVDDRKVDHLRDTYKE